VADSPQPFELLCLCPFCLDFCWNSFFSCRGKFESLLPCRNSLVSKSGRALFNSLINSISKSNADKIAWHRAKIYFETKF